VPVQVRPPAPAIHQKAREVTVELLVMATGIVHLIALRSQASMQKTSRACLDLERRGRRNEPVLRLAAENRKKCAPKLGRTPLPRSLIRINLDQELRTFIYVVMQQLEHDEMIFVNRENGRAQDTREQHSDPDCEPNRPDPSSPALVNDGPELPRDSNC
jgi:hypothetical protein